MKLTTKTCPACRRQFTPNHHLTRFCKGLDCIRARDRASVAKATARMVLAAPAGSHQRRRQLERCWKYAEGVR